MPQIPSVANLDRPVPQPQFPGRIAQYQPAGTGGVVGQAVAGTGQALLSVADAIEKANAELTRARRASQLTDAVGNATLQLGELEIKYRRDQDFKTAPQRFSQEAGTIGSQIALGIDDEVVRQTFRQRFNELAVAKQLNVLTSATQQEGDYNKAQLDTNLDVYATSAANASNPAERALVQNQAIIAIDEMRQAGWIADVDAQARKKRFFSKVDQSIVLRDMQANPFDTATKLSTDATYAPDLDIVMRQNLIDSGLRQAETKQRQAEAAMQQVQRDMVDKGMKDAFDKVSKGSLTRADVEALRPIISPGQYHELLSAMKNQGKASEDNSLAYARLQALLYPPGGGPPDMETIRREAFTAHARRQITDSTLSAVMSRAESLGRQEGPRSPYERNRAFITQALEPSQWTTDPAPRARQALAVREFDDWMSSLGGKAPGEEVMRAKANEIINNRSLVNMVELATKRGGSASTNPQVQLQEVETKARELIRDRAANKITQDEFERRSADLNRLRKQAEKLSGGSK